MTNEQFKMIELRAKIAAKILSGTKYPIDNEAIEACKQADIIIEHAKQKEGINNV